MPAKKKSTEDKSLSDVLTDLRKDPDIQIGGFYDFDTKVQAFSTGNIVLDAVTGIGGIPKGRITELVGMPSSGKTTASLQAAADCQQGGGTVFFADYERSFDPEYATSLGLDVEAPTFLYARPKHFEAGANTFRALVRTGEVHLGIFDSVATMVTKHELEADTGAVQVADRAKMMHQFLRQLNPLLAETGTAAIFLNHIMELVDATPMGRQMAAKGIKRKTSPGGRALPFYASLRIEFQQTGNIRSSEMDLLNNEEVDQVRQTKVQATVIKNKAGGDPFRQAELRVRFGKGFSQPFSILSILTAHKAVKKAGAWFTFPPELRLDKDDDNAKMQGEDSVLSLMEENPEWMATLQAAAENIVSLLGSDTFEQVDGTDFTANEAAENDIDGLLS